MKRLLVVPAAAAALAIAPSALAAPARSAPDTVIAKTKGGVLVANSRGTVSLVHANVRVGSRVMQMGTRMWVVGRAHTAQVRGIVVTSRPNMLVLSAAHRLFTVGLAGRRPAAVSTSPGSSPQAGDVVGVAVSIDAQGNITATSTEDDGPAGTSQQVQATVTAVGTNTITLQVNGQSFTLPIPPGTTVPTLATGQQVTLTITFSGGQANASEDEQGDNNQSGGDESSHDGNGGTTGSQTGGDDGDSGGGGGD